MNPEDLKINPLGLIIQDYHITNDLSKIKGGEMKKKIIIIINFNWFN